MYDNAEIKIMKKIYINLGIHKRGLSNQLKLTIPSIDYAIKKINSLVKKLISFGGNIQKNPVIFSLAQVSFIKRKVQ